MCNMNREKQTVRIVLETTPEIRRKLRLIMALRDLDSMKEALEQLIENAPEVAKHPKPE